MKKILATGSSGLIGSEVVRHFHDLGWQVFGIDNTCEQTSLDLMEIHVGISNNC